MVRQALESASPPQRKTPVTRRSALDPAKGWIDEMLRGDLTAPRQLFTLRLSYSGKAVHRVFSTAGQEAFTQGGHVDTFRLLRGIPTRHVRYDNLKPAVSQVRFGRSRAPSDGRGWP
ncbi:hypothetical protein ACGFX2_15845 [Streptomyces goshikiensis]|uniref:hypothetical protein n=1 Tax=Streptomyces goshikiensis TaxID=1942 RepID=UPI003721B309